MTDIKHLENLASQTRRDIVRMVHAVQSGHPGGSLGCADLFVALYHFILNYDSKNFSMNGEGEDLFFLSNGHISPVWYSVLARAGFFEVSELDSFRKLNTRLQGHPTTHEGLPGIRIASGSLGQGLSAAIGAAISKKLNNDDAYTYVLMGDGELQEGQVWEAAMFAGAKKVNRLIAFIDWNKRQIDGDTKDVMDLGDLDAKWKAFGWKTLEMDGNDMNSILSTVDKAKSEDGPVVILMKTEMGQGVDFMMGSHKWHGIPPSDEQLAQALEQLEETLGDY